MIANTNPRWSQLTKTRNGCFLDFFRRGACVLAEHERKGHKGGSLSVRAGLAIACEGACAAQQKCLPVGLRQRPRQNSLRIQYHCNRSRARYPPRQGCPDDPKIQQLHNHHLPTNAHFDTSTAAHTCDSFITVIHREQNPASKSIANINRFHANNADYSWSR